MYQQKKLHIRIQILISILFLCIISMTAAAQEVAIAQYAGNRQAALSLTFDDGLEEQYTLLFPRLKAAGLKGTFGLVGSRMNTQAKNPDRQTFTWAQAREMADDGQEMTSHGWSHKNVTKLTSEELRYEVQHNDTAIWQHTGVFPRTYFYPGNRKSDTAVEFCSQGRVGTRTAQVSLGSKRTVDWFHDWLRDLVSQGKWGVTMTHGIRHGYDAFGDETILWQMIDLAKSMQDTIWIATFRDVAAYTAERDCTTLCIKKKKRHIIVTPTTTLDKKIFTHPLTITVDRRPSLAKQKGRQLDIHERNGKWWMEFDPAGGKIDIVYKGDLLFSGEQ